MRKNKLKWPNFQNKNSYLHQNKFKWGGGEGKGQFYRAISKFACFNNLQILPKIVEIKAITKLIICNAKLIKSKKLNICDGNLIKKV